MSIGCKIVKDFQRPAPELVARFKDMPVANIDDNMGRIAAVDAAIEPIGYKGQLLGTAFTVRVPQGDNLMFHAAMDLAKPGDVIVIDAGGTVIMSETLELLGGEEMLGRRAVTPEVAAKVKGIIQRTLDYAAEHNLDIMGANPAPDNIAGGLTTIEEKALGAIKKGRTRPLVEVLEEGERPTKKGFVIMDAPAPGVENLTAIVSGGCHAVIFSTGKGNCIGHPVAPVIKISGNPMTVKSMRDNIDVDVSGVINQGLTIDQATDIVQDKLVDVCWGAMTSSDMLGEIETAASRLLRTL